MTKTITLPEGIFVCNSSEEKKVTCASLQEMSKMLANLEKVMPTP